MRHLAWFGSGTGYCVIFWSRGEVKLEHIAGVENDANFMTKTLGRVAFETQRLRINWSLG
jgi:hypothetical protein